MVYSLWSSELGLRWQECGAKCLFTLAYTYLFAGGGVTGCVSRSLPSPAHDAFNG